MKKKILFILFISGCFLTGSNAQSIAVKSNLLYDATSTLNMGSGIGIVTSVDFGCSPQL